MRYDRTFAGTLKRACDGRFFQLSIRSLRWPSWNRRVLRSQACAERRGQQWPAPPADEDDVHGRKAHNEKEQGIENAMEAAPTAHQDNPARICPATARRDCAADLFDPPQIAGLGRKTRGPFGLRPLAATQGAQHQDSPFPGVTVEVESRDRVPSCARQRGATYPLRFTTAHEPPPFTLAIVRKGASAF